MVDVKLSIVTVGAVMMALMPAIVAQTPNVLCMVEHCSSPMKNCVTDSMCIKAFNCMRGCDLSNMTCMLNCMYSYEDAKFDDFMKCIVTDHQCLNVSTSKPYPCKRPTKVAASFPFSMLKGQWYIVRGLHPIYDCFDCAISTFNPKGTSNTAYNISEIFNVKTIDGGIKQRGVSETVTLTTPGILRYTSLQMGLNTTSEWRILDYGDNYVFTYYCSDISGIPASEGSIVYSRTKSIAAGSIDHIKTVANASGLDFTKYCSPTFNNC